MGNCLVLTEGMIVEHLETTESRKLDYEINFLKKKNLMNTPKKPKGKKLNKENEEDGLNDYGYGSSAKKFVKANPGGKEAENNQALGDEVKNGGSQAKVSGSKKEIEKQESKVGKDREGNKNVFEDSKKQGDGADEKSKKLVAEGSGNSKMNLEDITNKIPDAKDSVKNNIDKVEQTYNQGKDVNEKIEDGIDKEKNELEKGKELAEELKEKAEELKGKAEEVKEELEAEAKLVGSE